MASVEASLPNLTSPSVPVEHGTGIRFQVTPEIKLPASLLPTETVDKILTQDWDTYIPHGFKLIGIWDKMFKKLKFVNKDDEIPHPFVRASFQAYSNHYPLKIRPDDIWLMILQAAGIHINMYSEELRSQFVNFDGKKILEVNRPEFVLDSLDNDWGEATLEFLKMIGENTVGDFKEICNTKFSTSTALDQVTRSMTVMHAMQKYFEYFMICGCGFPYVMLEGTKDDWIKLKESTSRLLAKLGEFGGKWSQSLLPLLDKMTEPFNGIVDRLFWNAMFIMAPIWGSSGMGKRWVLMSGWVNVFFPYLIGSNGYQANYFCVPYNEKNVIETERLGGKNDRNRAPDWKDFPDGRVYAPGSMIFPPTTYNIRYYSGFVGVNQDTEGVLSTQVGWYVLRDLKNPS